MKITPFPLDELSRGCPSEIDIFVCSASFEKRCLLIPESLSKSVSIKKSIVCFIEGTYQSVIAHSDELCAILQKGTVAKVPLNSDEPLKNAISINREFEASTSNDSLGCVFIDATTFTHENLMIIVRLLMEHKANIKDLRIGYVGAEDYDINEPDPAKKWLSTGIESIRSVVGYPGVISPARKNHLIVLFGFELDRTLALINNLEFHELSLGFGSETDSIKGEHFIINRDRHQILLDQFANASSFCFSLTDPEAAVKDLSEQILKFDNHNIVIAAMNNKVSTIGAAMVAIANPRIQIIYAKPLEYNTKGYSKPRSEAYVYHINTSNPHMVS
jgi:hypothetical protein